jgi:hypothetical protein
MITYNTLHKGVSDIENGLPGDSNDSPILETSSVEDRTSSVEDRTFSIKNISLPIIGTIILFGVSVVLFIFSMQATNISLKDIHEMCPTSTMKQFVTIATLRYYIQIFLYNCILDLKLIDYTWLINVAMIIWGTYELCLECANNLIGTELYTMAVVHTIVATIYLIFNVSYFIYKLK